MTVIQVTQIELHFGQGRIRRVILEIVEKGELGHPAAGDQTGDSREKDFAIAQNRAGKELVASAIGQNRFIETIEHEGFIPVIDEGVFDGQRACD
jgi:hypothetical protein